MENKIIEVVESIPTIIKNTHLNVTLEGWPAALTALALCCSGVAVYALKVTHPNYYSEDSSNVASKAA